MNKTWEPLSEHDYKVVVNQLDREPRGVLGVPLRCSYGYPQIIANRSINYEGEAIKVFPTVFWLTCPYLKKAVSQLESGGMISEVETKIAEDPDFAAAVEQGHAEHAKLRQVLFPANVQESLAKNYPKEFQVLKETGVGGIRARDGVKCLHAHFADYLVRGKNVIGELVLNKLSQEVECSSGDCTLEG